MDASLRIRLFELSGTPGGMNHGVSHVACQIFTAGSTKRQVSFCASFLLDKKDRNQHSLMSRVFLCQWIPTCRKWEDGIAKLPN